jgi:single-strand DNA-binding protein
VANLNVVSIIGNLTRDPDLRFTSQGLAVCNFSIASNRRWQNKTTNEWEEATSYYDVTVWGIQGQNVAESMQKGDRAVIVGRLEQRTWEDQDGNKRSKFEVVADVVGATMEWATIDSITKNDKSAFDGGSYTPNEQPF